MITRFVSILAALLLGWHVHAGAQELYALTRGSSSGAASKLSIIDRTTGVEIDAIGSLLLEGSPVNARGMAMDPVSGLMYVSINGSSNWRLGTIDLADSTVSLVGSFGDYEVRDLTFDATGQLYGVTGTEGTYADSLVEIDKLTGTTTYKVTISSGIAHSIAFYPGQPQVLYHLCVDGVITYQPIFEVVTIATNEVTPIAVSGDLGSTRPGGLVWDPIASVFRSVGTSGSAYLAITPEGVITDLGQSSKNYHGLAFDQATTNLETIFCDNFESGGTGAWSAVVGDPG